VSRLYLDMVKFCRADKFRRWKILQEETEREKEWKGKKAEKTETIDVG